MGALFPPRLPATIHDPARGGDRLGFEEFFDAPERLELEGARLLVATLDFRR